MKNYQPALLEASKNCRAVYEHLRKLPKAQRNSAIEFQMKQTLLILNQINRDLGRRTPATNGEGPRTWGDVAKELFQGAQGKS